MAKLLEYVLSSQEKYIECKNLIQWDHFWPHKKIWPFNLQKSSFWCPIKQICMVAAVCVKLRSRRKGMDSNLPLFFTTYRWNGVKIPFGGYEDILLHKPFVMLQGKQGMNASANKGFQELSAFNVYLHMNDNNTHIQSRQHEYLVLVQEKYPDAELIYILSWVRSPLYFYFSDFYSFMLSSILKKEG